MLNMNIKAERTRMGMTQTELAEKIGVTKYTIIKYEKGITEPMVSNFIKLAEVLNVTTDELLK